MKSSLRSRILRLFLGLMFISSLGTIIAVLLATNSSADDHVRERLVLGHKVLRELLDYQGNQLVDSAQLLTADFGFKSSVSAGDSATIESTLRNHGDRINADLMLLISLQGKLLASTKSEHLVKFEFPLNDALAQAKEQGGLLSEVQLDDKLYQIVMVPVLAPIPIAWAAMGFEIDERFAQQLKELTHLDVTMTAESKDAGKVYTSTISESSGMLPGLFGAYSGSSSDWLMHEHGGQEMISLRSTLDDNASIPIDVILSESLEEEYLRFAPLRIQLLLISVVVLAISIVGAIIIAGNVTRPIVSLVGVTRRISGGDYSETIDIDNTATKELGDLAESIRSMQEDISAREARITYQLYHDNLTDLPNRNQITQTIENLINEPCERFAVVTLNINRFKQFNDTFGFDIGDQLLKAVSDRLQQNAPGDKCVARIGADEFALVYRDIDSEQLTDRIHSLENCLEQSMQIDDIECNISVRIGLANFPEHGEKADQLLKRSTIALGLAKQNKADFATYESGLDAVHIKKITMINELKLAMERDQLTMYYQPKLDLGSHQVAQVEALIRWIHPEMGFISPGEFIPLAEQSGLMPELTRWVIKRVIRDIQLWREKQLGFVAAINLSAYDLTYESLPNDVLAWLTAGSLSAKDLIFEVTESAVMDDPEFAVGILQRFREMGVSLSIDDFGTGYSSLSQLKKMPVDELKIDMSFIRHLDQDKDDQVIVKSTIDMAHNIGLTVVAEGVENKESWALLASWGCNKLQGFYISKPMPNDDLLNWLSGFDCAAIGPDQVPKKAQ